MILASVIKLSIPWDQTTSKTQWWISSLDKRQEVAPVVDPAAGVEAIPRLSKSNNSSNSKVFYFRTLPPNRTSNSKCFKIWCNSNRTWWECNSQLIHRMPRWKIRVMPSSKSTTQTPTSVSSSLTPITWWACKVKCRWIQGSCSQWDRWTTLCHHNSCSNLSSQCSRLTTLTPLTSCPARIDAIMVKIQATLETNTFIVKPLTKARAYLLVSSAKEKIKILTWWPMKTRASSQAISSTTVHSTTCVQKIWKDKC